MTAPLLSGGAKVAGVLGQPICHSLSPLLHGAWIAAAGLDAAYVPLAPKDEAGFAKLIDAGRGGLFAGFNVTAPFKEAARKACDMVDDAAGQAGSVNLMLFHGDGRIEGRSTDGAGVLYAFKTQAPEAPLAHRPVVILGAGGAARAAAAALLDQGCPEVRIVNRSPGRAEALQNDLGPQVFAYSLADADQALAGAGALINAVSSGETADLDALPSDAAVLDMTYKPLKTPTLQAAEARGLTTCDGLQMLIGQAMPSFEALFGRAPPSEVDVRSLALSALAVRP